jgi:hypothetical protein
MRFGDVLARVFVDDRDKRLAREPFSAAYPSLKPLPHTTIRAICVTWLLAVYEKIQLHTDPTAVS